MMRQKKKIKRVYHVPMLSSWGVLLFESSSVTADFVASLLPEGDRSSGAVSTVSKPASVDEIGAAGFG